MRYRLTAGVMLSFLIVLFLIGCSGKNRKIIEDASAVDMTYKVYYVKDTLTGIEGTTWNYRSETPEELVGECLKVLSESPESKGCISPIEHPVAVAGFEYDEVHKEVQIHFNSAYSDMEKNREVLARAAIVKTLTQFDMLIDYVKFYIGDEVLTDGSGNVRRMMKYDFVESTSADIKYISERTFRLYFASSDGLQLAEEDVNIHYLESASLASVIMESLIAGPLSANLNRTFPADTKLNNVEVKEKICYVDMNQRFLESMDNISFKVKVYSVVNSLCDLEDIEGVQILIDGNIWDTGDAEVDLTQVLHEDLSMVPKAADVPPVVEKTSIE